MAKPINKESRSELQGLCIRKSCGEAAKSPKPSSPQQAAGFSGSLNKIELTSFLGGLCLFLSTIEYLFPRPVPFMRLGLANLPVLFALRLLPFPYIMLLVLLKITGQGLISGTLASYVFLFSAAGSFTSAMVMYSVFKIPSKWISLIGVSILGALAGNIVQLILSVKFIFGESAWVIAPLFLLIGTVSSFLIGLFAVKFLKRSRWISSLEGRL